MRMSEEKIQQLSGNNAPKNPASSKAKLLIDFGPLIVFFATFKLSDGDMMLTTAVFMGAITIGMVASRMILGKVSKMLWFTFVVVMVTGSLTLWLDDDRFVKMKLTIINCVLASVLLFGMIRDKLYLKMLMEMALEMSDAGWRLFTRNYALFMLAMAVLNEVIWRTQTDDFWVNFKTFGYMVISIVFMAMQITMLVKGDYMTLAETSDNEKPDQDA